MNKYNLINPTTLIRKCDKSFIEHRGLTVPKNLYDYFGVNEIELGSKKNIILEYQGVCYKAHFVREKIKLARIRLFWDVSLKKEFKKIADSCKSLPSVKFEKITTEYYKVTMIGDVLVEDMIDEIDYEQHQNDEANYQLIKGYSEEELEKLYIEREKEKPKLRESKKKRYTTDIRLKVTRNQMSHYQCEIDHSHKTFVSRSDVNNYVECHHLIPMMAQEEFLPIYLDSLFNLISLCPICHAQFHYGNKHEVESIFWRAYDIRKEELEKVGITKDIMEYILNKYYLP